MTDAATQHTTAWSVPHPAYPAYQDAQDKHRAAAHEAGHMTVALAAGRDLVEAEIRPHDAVDPSLESSWIGYTRWFGSRSGAISVAGRVAEEIMEDPGVWACQIADLLATGLIDLSPTDAEDIDLDDETSLRQHVDEAFVAIQEHRRFFDWAVVRLLDQEIVFDWEAARKFREVRDV